jgi:predicted  nucleic acid-binding Zn-ribbon protein
MQVRVTDLSHHTEILQLDKQFLQKELESSMHRTEAAERELARVHEKVRDLKRRKEDLIQQVADARDQGKAVYEQKLGAVGTGRGARALVVRG